MKEVKIILLAIIFSGLLGCEASVGDKCTTSNDCPTGTVCDTDSPGGYCLVSSCESDEECPEEAVCVSFTKSMSYCLKKCKKDSDCRSKYTCRDDIGEKKFCYIAPDYSYGRDEDSKIDFVAPESETPSDEENAQ